MLLTPWLSFLKSPFSRSARSLQKRRVMSSSVERLEDRTLLSFTATFNNGVLAIIDINDVSQAAIVDGTGGILNFTNITGVPNGSIPVSTVTSITYTEGSGNSNTITLQNLTANATTSVSLAGGPVGDTFALTNDT